MRILHIRLKNINALNGEWQIDLKHPDYTANGLFAITGSTGAGKTTLLDAICLALYGCTPRLPQINKTANELMSRHTGECFAEVHFATTAGEFHCRWGQHRARHKASGKLQEAQHELSRADGTILENKISAVPKRVQMITGMDFKQFTRSVLLAQGQFAALLQSKPDERAPLLEQITGTEIYSAISVAVFQRARSEQQKLEQIRTRMTQLQLLDTEAEQALYEQKTTLQTQENDLAAHQLTTQQTLQWLQGIAALKEQLGQYELEQRDLNQAVTQFQLQQSRLEKAERAAQIEDLYQQRQALQPQLEHAKANSLQLGTMLVASQQQYRNAENAWQQAKQQLEQHNQDRKEALKCIKEVRDLDEKILKQQLQMQNQQDKTDNLSREGDDLRQQIEQNQKKLKQVQTKIDHAQVYLSQYAQDERLAEYLPLIEKQIAEWQDKLAEQEQLQTKIQQLEQELTDAQTVYQKCLQQWQSQQTALTQAKATEHRLNQEINQLLEEKNYSDLRRQHESLLAQQQQLLTAQQKQQYCQAVQEQINLNQERIQELQQGQQSNQQQLNELIIQQQALDAELDSAQQQKNIIDLAQWRSQLQDQQPCPLCGSLDHPYAKTLPATLSPNNWQTLQQKAKKLAQQIKNAEIEQAKLAQSEADLTRQHAEQQLQLQEAEEILCALPPNLAEHQQTLTQQLEQSTSRLDALDDLNQQLKQCQQPGLQQSAEEAERRVNQAQNQLKQIEQALTQQQQSLDKLKQKIIQHQHALQTELAAFQLELNVKELLPALQQRSQKWREQQRQYQESQRNSDRLQTILIDQEKRWQKLSTEFSQAEAELKQSQQVLDQQQQARAALYDAKDPDQERVRLDELQEQLQQAVNDARDACHQAQRQVDSCQSDQRQSEWEITKLQAELAAKQAAFSARCAECGFVDETAFSAARLDKKERQTLQDQAEKLKQHQQQLHTRQQDTQQKLAIEQQKTLTTESEAQLQQQLIETAEQIKQLQRDSGAVQQKLDHQAKLKQSQQALDREYQTQRRAYQPWQRLDALIGSSDGKKYRRFAQGLTFAWLITGANTQLSAMSDRYVLLPDPDKPLELSVIDQYQAGAMRSIKNLSGGESFIVSLALALGLAQMASRNVQVDSLFLDEGFGTLDEQALDTALTALAGLRQQGKLIGVISHVKALQDRIPTQIQVIPQSGGRSILRGSGCSR